MASGGNGSRSCLGCPGWPPILRRSWPSGGAGFGGLTMSEEGGLEDVAEFLRAAASCSWSLAMVASSTASRASNRRQFGQDFRALDFMARYAKSLTAISPYLYR